MDVLKVSQCVEALCECGCTAVRATISALEEGHPVPLVEGLSQEERQSVRDELKAIMSVYDRH